MEKNVRLRINQSTLMVSLRPLFDQILRHTDKSIESIRYRRGRASNYCHEFQQAISVSFVETRDHAVAE